MENVNQLVGVYFEYGNFENFNLDSKLILKIYKKTFIVFQSLFYSNYNSKVVIFYLPPQESISSTFYEQLLREQTPKAQKKIVKSSSIFALLESACVKATRRMLVKLTPDLYPTRNLTLPHLNIYPLH